MKTQKIKYVGGVAELKGRYYDIPQEIPLSEAAAYVEKEWQMAQDAKAAEEFDRSLKAEARANGRKQKDAQVAAMQKRIAALENELKGLQSEQPDLLQLASTSANVAAMIESVHRIARDAESLNAQLEDNLALVTDLADKSETFAEEADEERQKTLNLIKSNQFVVNNSFAQWTSKISAFERKLEDMSYDLGQTAQVTQDAWRAVEKARSITEASKEMARVAAQEEIASLSESFYASVQIMLKTLGITRSAALQTLNASKVTDGVVLTADEIAEAVRVYTSTTEEMEEVDNQLDVASAASTLNRFTS
jgi:uncharacterized protein YlzI (FlbEa/FlbD family)